MTRDADKLRPILGLDVGATKAVVVLARADGEILAESRLEVLSMIKTLMVCIDMPDKLLGIHVSLKV